MNKIIISNQSLSSKDKPIRATESFSWTDRIGYLTTPIASYIKNIENINALDREGRLLLNIAIALYSEDIINQVLDKNPDVNLVDTSGKTPLATVLIKSSVHLSIIELLIKHGAKIHEKNEGGVYPIMQAVVSSNLSYFGSLVKAGADIHAQNDYQQDCLIIACKKRDLDLVKILITLGANVNHQDSTGLSSLMWATANGTLEIVECLLNNGANVDLKNKDNKTAFDIAENSKFVELAKLLKSYKENKDLKEHYTENKTFGKTFKTKIF